MSEKTGENSKIYSEENSQNTPYKFKSSRARTVKELDEGQFEMMWNFLRMGHQKPNISALCGLCDQLRQAMIQKTAGQRREDPAKYVDFGDIGTIINSIVIETMCLYLSGNLEKLAQKEEISQFNIQRGNCDE